MEPGEIERRGRSRGEKHDRVREEVRAYLDELARRRDAGSGVEGDQREEA